VRTKNIATLLTLVLVALTAAGCAGNEQANEDNTEDQSPTEGSSGEKDGGPEATLELQGEPGTEFSGSCTIGDEEPKEISWQIPESFTYELKERPLECEISSDGDVQVDLTVGKNVHSVQRISGGTLKLIYENGSISSVVSSSTGSSRQGSSSSSQGDTSSEASGVTSEPRDVSSFDEVELRGVGNLSIQQADNESLSVEAEQDVLPKIRTEVENSRLIIGPEPNTTINTAKPINYRLTVKELNALEVSGSGDVEAEDIDNDELAVTISGAGDVEISGKVDSQDVEISGSGDYRAEALESKEGKIDVGGSGSARVNVSDKLDAEVSGSGSVEYVGDPTIDQEVSGAGEVRKQELSGEL
jgi:Putative auto-transporter adhesin, head GIN domain